MKPIRILPIFVISIFLVGLLLMMFTAVRADTITVNSNLDTADPSPLDGNCDVDAGTPGNQCTLRAAIQTAQEIMGADEIHFASSMNINVNSYLELFEEGLTIEASPGQIVRINGQDSAQNIFYITGSNVTISNVVVYGSAGGWSNIWVDDAEGVVIANNLIGDDDPAPGGCGQSNNSFGGIYVSSSSTVLTDTNRVWIYGNIIECHTGSVGDGITLYDTDAVFIGKHADDAVPLVPGNVIRNNRTGIAISAGDLHFISGNVIENNIGHGIAITGSTDTIIVGCYSLSVTSPAQCRNRIRGNGEAGVHVAGNNVGTVGLAYNWIGLADDGVTAVPNNIGLHLHTDNYRSFVISNTISGNTEDGIRIQESAGRHLVWGNVIGLGADGDTAVANGSHGISLFDDAGGTQIGVELPAYRNFISANEGYGILVSNSPSTTIQGNYIGLARNGVTQRGNGYNGIYVLNSDYTEIGNVPDETLYGTQKITGNGEAGIYLENADYSLLGPANDITYNDGAGIYIYNSQYNLIFPHLVSRNAGEGIQLSGNSSFYNRIVAFEVSYNGRLPIDFGAPGLELNDPGDTDSGPNHLLNVPEVTLTSGTVITGTACASCFIFVFEAKGDPTANGGGGIYRGVTFSDATGIWSYDLADAGLELRPVSFMAFSGPINLEDVDSSPLSPVTQLGFGIYLPTINK